MKRTLFLVISLSFASKCWSQYNGVYLSKEDFANAKATTFDRGDSTITLIENFDGSVTVQAKNQTKKYKFGSIYGYYKDGVKYRTYGSRRTLFSTYGYCKVLDESGLIIYSKSARHHRSNGYIWHYYSKSPTSDIKPLTLKNLKVDFSDNREFIEIMTRSMERKDYLREVNGRLMINEIYILKRVSSNVKY